MQAARWLRGLNRTGSPATGLLVLGQGVVGSAAAVAAATDHHPYQLGTGVKTDSTMVHGRAAVLIDAAPSLSKLYSSVFPLVGVRLSDLFHSFRAVVSRIADVCKTLGRHDMAECAELGLWWRELRVGNQGPRQQWSGWWGTRIDAAPSTSGPCARP